jgi:dienelactone hydrolase
VLRKTLLTVAVAFGLAVPAATAAPTVITGEKNGAPYRIVVPEDWNGTLVVHAHGYRDLADHPGEVDDRSARKYVRRFADYDGKLKEPVLTLHTQTDSLVPPSHESAYAATVAEAGRSALLAQTFTSGNGHCNFTGPQLLTALGALDAWVATGTKPTAASFPAALGFVPGFTAPAWPQE